MPEIARLPRHAFGDWSIPDSGDDWTYAARDKVWPLGARDSWNERRHRSDMKACEGPGKVVDLMSALRQSLAAKEAPKAPKQAAKTLPAKRKLKLVSGKRSKTA
jgi:hypothetical protein